jgi:hypothetical protein
LDTISKNIDAWNLDKGNEPCFECEYSCVENFSTTILFKELSYRLGLDPHVFVEVSKSFSDHLNVPEKGFDVYIQPLKFFAYVSKVEKQVNQVSSVTIEEYVETPPYPSRVKENLLITVANKSARTCHEPYEQVEVKNQVLVIKELNEETSCDVYLCEDSTKIIQGNTTKVGKPIISCAIGTSCYHVLCDI